MPMNPRLLRPRLSGPTHPETKDWLSRVKTNGGTASSSTLSAMDTFCRSIDAQSGLRAAILRLNLFCGNNLNACLVPLYRGASLSGTQLGNTTDTNNGPFVSGDFQETGSGGGLKGDGTAKYLTTGVTPGNITSLSSVHLSISGTGLETSGNAGLIGTYDSDANGQGLYCLDAFASYVSARAVRLSTFGAGNFPVVTSPGTSEPHFIGTRTALNAAVAYRGGTSAATSSSTVATLSHSRAFAVFTFQSGASTAGITAGRLRMYSIGNGLTAAQALAFSNAVIAFNTALGRA